MVLTLEDGLRAAELLAEVEIKMGTVFRGLGRSDISDLINEAIRYIETSKINEIPVWQFARAFEGNMDKFVMTRVLDTLEASKYIQIIKRPEVGQSIVILGK